MSVSLQYDLDIFTAGKDKIDNLKNNIDTAKRTMESGLDQLRRDWVSEGGDAFFQSIDQDWAKNIETCIHVLEDLYDAVEKASSKYGEIQSEAAKYLHF